MRQLDPVAARAVSRGAGIGTGAADCLHSLCYCDPADLPLIGHLRGLNKVQMMNQTYWNETIETLPRAELEAYQTRQLATHLELAYRRSNYYHEAFETANVKPADFQYLEDLERSLNGWNTLTQ